MKQSQKITIGIIIVLVLLSLYGLYPSMVFHSKSNEEKTSWQNSNPEEFYSYKNRALRLGLDLKGGMHLLLELDTGKMMQNLVENQLGLGSSPNMERARFPSGPTQRSKVRFTSSG